MRQNQDERGTGVVGTAFGAAVFIAFLLLATHTLLSLYASSVVSSTAWDAARMAADSDDTASAKANAQTRLHGFKNASVVIDKTTTDVSVRIQADRPMFLPRGLANSSGLGRIDKTVHARVENWQ
jgi:Flp pilus assembly protein TadG